jgi:hypothetical protein
MCFPGPGAYRFLGNTPASDLLHFHLLLSGCGTSTAALDFRLRTPLILGADSDHTHGIERERRLEMTNLEERKIYLLAQIIFTVLPEWDHASNINLLSICW